MSIDARFGAVIFRAEGNARHVFQQDARAKQYVVERRHRLHVGKAFNQDAGPDRPRGHGRRVPRHHHFLSSNARVECSGSRRSDRLHGDRTPPRRQARIDEPAHDWDVCSPHGTVPGYGGARGSYLLLTPRGSDSSRTPGVPTEGEPLRRRQLRPSWALPNPQAVITRA